MIQQNKCKIAFVNANRKYQKIGVSVPGTSHNKVIFFEASLDEQFRVDEEMVLTLTRAEVTEDPLGLNE